MCFVIWQFDVFRSLVPPVSVCIFPGHGRVLAILRYEPLVRDMKRDSPAAAVMVPQWSIVAPRHQVSRSNLYHTSRCHISSRFSRTSQTEFADQTRSIDQHKHAALYFAFLYGLSGRGALIGFACVGEVERGVPLQQSFEGFRRRFGSICGAWGLGAVVPSEGGDRSSRMAVRASAGPARKRAFWANVPPFWGCHQSAAPLSQT